MIKNFEEAKSTDDLRVMYVTRRNDLLKQEFDVIWSENEESIFKESKAHYNPVIKKNHEIIKNAIDEILTKL